MVKTVPHWNSFRVRNRVVSRDNPGTHFVDYVPGELIYVRNAAGSIMYCIDAENGQIVSEGQPLFPNQPSPSASDNSHVPSFSPIDGSLAIGITQQSSTSSTQCVGVTNRGGDTSCLFPVTFQVNGGIDESIRDCANTNGQSVYYTSSSIGTGSQTIGASLYSCVKSTLSASGRSLITTQSVGVAGGVGIDVDRESNVYLYLSLAASSQEIQRLGSWATSPSGIPAYRFPNLDKLVAVGPPLQSGSIWFQSLYVGNPAGWLSQHDCRTGTLTAGGQTSTAHGWPYDLQPQWLNATKDGLIVFNSAALAGQYPNGAIEKLSYANLSLIWRHVPNSVQSGFTGQVAGSPTVDSLGNVIYPTIADTTGAVHFRKLNGNDGSLAWDHPFWLPIANQPLVSSAGRIGAFSMPGEQWLNAGQPQISF